MKLRPKGSSGGHNGLKSIIAHLDGEDFPRLKIGIGRGRGDDVIDHVLGHFGEEEWKLIANMMEKGRDCAFLWLDRGIDEAMNRYNVFSKLPKPPKEEKEKEESSEQPEKA